MAEMADITVLNEYGVLHKHIRDVVDELIAPMLKKYAKYLETLSLPEIKLVRCVMERQLCRPDVGIADNDNEFLAMIRFGAWAALDKWLNIDMPKDERLAMSQADVIIIIDEVISAFRGVGAEEQVEKATALRASKIQRCSPQ